MGLSPQLITEGLYNKAVTCLKSLSKENREAIRLRAIVSAKEYGVSVVAKVFNVNTNTIRAWVKRFESSGVSGLTYQSGRGRRCNLSEVHIEAIRNWTKDDSGITIASIVSNLKDKFGVKSSKSGVHRILHKLNLSYITPRPVHHKQDKTGHPEFKKKSQGDYRKQSR
jgi:transposase